MAGDQAVSRTASLELLSFDEFSKESAGMHCIKGRAQPWASSQ